MRFLFPDKLNNFNDGSAPNSLSVIYSIWLLLRLNSFKLGICVIPYKDSILFFAKSKTSKLGCPRKCEHSSIILEFKNKYLRLGNYWIGSSSIILLWDTSRISKNGKTGALFPKI